MLAGEFGHGWLTFESDTSIRRRSPIPPGWETAPATLLESLCLRSPESRRSPSRESPVIDEEGSSGQRQG